MHGAILQAPRHSKLGRSLGRRGGDGGYLNVDLLWENAEEGRKGYRHVPREDLPCVIGFNFSARI